MLQPENTIDLSIIIVSFNTRDILKQCLQSVYEQARQVDFEVIVIDNNSADASVEMIKRGFPGVILIANSANRGFAAANNQGMKQARGRYILLLNSDTMVLHNAVDKMFEFAESNSAAAVFGCKVLNPNRTLQSTCFMFPSLLNMLLSSTYLYKLFPHNRFFGREAMSWWDRNDVRQVDVVTGCFMLVRRKAIEQVGLMDERFFMYAEEADWCYRFNKAGWEVLFTPQAEIVHFGGQSTKNMANDMTLQLRAGILQFIQKHRNRAIYWCACMLTGLFFAIRIPAWFIVTVLSRKRQSYNWSHVVTYAKGLRVVLKGADGLCFENRNKRQHTRIISLQKANSAS